MNDSIDDPLAIIVGSWAYVHMGEVAVGSVPYSSQISQPYQYTPYTVNGTVTFDLSKGWTDSRQVQFQNFNKPSDAIYNFASLWHDKTQNQIFCFGGEQSFLNNSGDVSNPTPDLSTWRLQPDGQGRGTWSQNATSRSVPFGADPQITRPFGGASTQSDKLGFYLGGYSSSHSSDKTSSLSGFQPTPGLVTYEFATGIWQNLSIPSIPGLDLPHGTYEWGGMEFISTVGPNGLVVMWGGESSGLDSYTPGQNMRSMSSITLYDPVQKTWYTQQTSGPTPSPRSRFCSISVPDLTPVTPANKTGTHEIYMYGGWNGKLGPDNIKFDEIWVLSLPSFAWQQLDASQKNARFGHTCHLAAERHLLSIGGADPSLSDPWASPDFSSATGLSVYDLSAAQWKQGLNASADAYHRPQKVQKWYDQNGVFPSTWTMPALDTLITTGSANTIALDSSAPPSSASSANFPGSLPSDLSGSSKAGPSKAAHAGIIVGAVVGGLTAACLPFLILIYFLRRKQRREQATFHELSADPRSRRPSERQIMREPTSATSSKTLASPFNNEKAFGKYFTSPTTTQQSTMRTAERQRPHRPEFRSMSRYLSYGRIKSKLLCELPANEPNSNSRSSVPLSSSLAEPAAIGGVGCLTKPTKATKPGSTDLHTYFGSFAPVMYGDGGSAVWNRDISSSIRTHSFSSTADTDVCYPDSILDGRGNDEDDAMEDIGDTEDYDFYDIDMAKHQTKNKNNSKFFIPQHPAVRPPPRAAMRARASSRMSSADAIIAPITPLTIAPLAVKSRAASGVIPLRIDTSMNEMSANTAQNHNQNHNYNYNSIYRNTANTTTTTSRSTSTSIPIPREGETMGTTFPLPFPGHGNGAGQNTALSRSLTRSSAGALPAYRKRSSSIYTSATRSRAPSRRLDSNYGSGYGLGHGILDEDEEFWLPHLRDGLREWEEKEGKEKREHEHQHGNFL